MKPDSYRHNLYAFTNRILVICPSCAKPAWVTAPGLFQEGVKSSTARLSCVHCGFNDTNEDDNGSGKLIGAAVDPYFRKPLWLTRACCGQLLWAYNAEHLALLKQHVGAGLRERNGLPRANKSIGSRLPRWMTAASNRQKVLKAIRELEKMNISLSRE